MKSDRKSIGARIRGARQLRNLTQEDLAALCGWESQSRVSHYEVDRRVPDLEDIETIAQALRMSPVELLYGVQSGPVTGLERVPIVGTNECLEPADQSPTHYLDAPCRDLNAFALRIVGAGLAPRMRAGEAILIEPSAKIEPGDPMLVILRNKTLKICDLVRVTLDELTLDEIAKDRNREVVAMRDVESVATITRVSPASLVIEA